MQLFIAANFIIAPNLEPLKIFFSRLISKKNKCYVQTVNINPLTNAPSNYVKREIISMLIAKWSANLKKLCPGQWESTHCGKDQWAGGGVWGRRTPQGNTTMLCTITVYTLMLRFTFTYFPRFLYWNIIPMWCYPVFCQHNLEIPKYSRVSSCSLSWEAQKLREHPLSFSHVCQNITWRSLVLKGQKNSLPG